ncbi:hypothetical protein Scep_030286 [Stephania cephalantha]|uniref:FLZ-type domain-containing protein n=1 Tax=Stephania cephalantha TaxID=152367 RepID=A0AAP0DZ98_9MAGN
MLRKRSRPVNTKQALMGDNGSSLVSSPTNKYTIPTSSYFLNSPRLFTGFSETEALMSPTSLLSPTSILDNMPFAAALGNPFGSERSNGVRSSPDSCLESKHPWEKKLDSRGVGLGIIDALNGDELDMEFNKPESRMILFGSQLKIQIPPLSPSPPWMPESPPGQKTHNAQFDSLSFSSGLSPGNSKKSPFGSVNSVVGTPVSPRIFTGCLSPIEMESSEDYTCVITHGPNPKTTHIFEDCIVENCCGVVGLSSLRKGSFLSADAPNYPSRDFLSFCYTCEKSLDHGKDIYIYRGEKAFCSHECRDQEILFENPE